MATQVPDPLSRIHEVTPGLPLRIAVGPGRDPLARPGEDAADMEVTLKGRSDRMLTRVVHEGIATCAVAVAARSLL
jgi:hypothetical protein